MIVMTEIMQRVWNWYSRDSVQKALIEVAKSREVTCIFRDGNFGKRPNVLQYPQDILQDVAEGAVSFHGSVERWSQPMKLDVGLTKPDLDNLRIGWDLFIDLDVSDFEIAKAAVRQMMETFKDHGVSSYSVKFTGGKSFHIGIPFESLPEKINMQPTRLLYPEILQKVLEYIKFYASDGLKDEILAIDTPQNISTRINKPLKDISTEEGIEPFKIVNMDIFGSRHLFRLPFSLHENSLLVSLPIKPGDVAKFEKEQAQPEKVKIEEKFLSPKAGFHDAEALVVEALDWSSKNMKEEKEELPKPKLASKIRYVPEESFPPCIQGILKGVADGRKRSTFVLINFLRNMGWDLEKLEKRVTEWNDKNIPPLRANYLRTQLRWHLRQNRNLLPPNCENQMFYSTINVCNPDYFCKGGTDKIAIKNPVNYPFKKFKLNRNTKRR